MSKSLTDAPLAFWQKLERAFDPETMKARCQCGEPGWLLVSEEQVCAFLEKMLRDHRLDS